MKKYSLVFIFLFIGYYVAAQSVGIGTGSPNSSAQLDVSSINKGVLFPRMTTSQRLGILTPSNGLMVYDTDKNEIYHYTTAGWRAVLNSDYWIRPATARSRIANSTDSIGIGTLSPTERLDVQGNMRVRNNLQADNNISASGIISGGTLQTPGNLVAAGTGLVNGNLSTNSKLTAKGDVVIENTGATLQLVAEGDNKAYFQLSGNNLRLGTNSGNTNGNLIIRMNGTDQVTVRENGNVGIGNTGSAVYKLYITGNSYADGDINLYGKVKRTSISGETSLLPVCLGRINPSGSILSGSGNFTVTKNETGSYSINSGTITSTSTVLVTSESYGTSGSARTFHGRVDLRFTNAFWGEDEDCVFSFVVYTPSL